MNSEIEYPEQQEVLGVVKDELKHRPDIMSHGYSDSTLIDIDSFFQTTQWYTQKFIAMNKDDVTESTRPPEKVTSTLRKNHEIGGRFREMNHIMNLVAQSAQMTWDTWATLGTDLAAFGVTTGALRCYDECLKENPDCYSVLYNMGRITQIINPKSADAKNRLRNLADKMNFNPGHYKADIMLALSEMYYQDQNLALTAQILREILKFDHRNAQIINNLSVLLLNLGDAKGAYETFSWRIDEIINPHMRANWAAILYFNNKYSECKEWIGKLYSDKRVKCDPHVQKVCGLILSWIDNEKKS